MMAQSLDVVGLKKIYPQEHVGKCIVDEFTPEIIFRSIRGLPSWGFSVIKSGCLLLLSMGCLWGCTAPIKQIHPITEQQRPPLYMASETPQPAAEGSLWQENGTMGELFINPKARRVGDIVTIKIVESSKASNNATTSTGRDSSVDVGIDKFLGLENNVVPTQGLNPLSRIAGSASNKFTGQGGTSRSGDLNAYITTRVIGVLPSGNLAISGSREVIVNNEAQMIMVSGVIRPRDISPDNVVQSTFISDARIAYSGSGIVNDQQRKGWLANILDVVSPF
jgi:flagellar L-ring protein precursor FlgH